RATRADLRPLSKRRLGPATTISFLPGGAGEDSTCRMEKYYHEKNGLRTGTARVTSRSSLRVANAWGSRRVAPAADHVLGALLECARGMPQAAAFRFLGRRAELDTVFDYEELLCCVAGAAGRLREAGVEPGDRVLLLCPPGPEYVVSLFGCFYAGAIAVPAYPPQFNRPAERIVTLARDAAPRLALTTEPLAERLADLRLGVPIVPVSLARGDPSAV